jgi:aminoglycoside 3-N-acetyltransferase
MTKLFTDLPDDPFGSESAFDKLKQLKGKLLFLGADFHWCTFNHHIEEAAHVPYRRRQRVRIAVRAEGKLRETTAYRFTKSDRYRIDFGRFRKLLVQRGILREAALGNGYLAMVDAQALFEAGMEQLERDKYYFLRVTPVMVHLTKRARELVGKFLRSLSR